jgi:hypothetical protein
MKGKPSLLNSSSWFLTRENGQPLIIKDVVYSDGRAGRIRHPRKNYKHLLESEGELKDYVIRLNGKDPKWEKVKDKIATIEAFFNQKDLSDYQAVLHRRITEKRWAETIFYYLKRYAIAFPSV